MDVGDYIPRKGACVFLDPLNKELRNEIGQTILIQVYFIVKVFQFINLQNKVIEFVLNFITNRAFKAYNKEKGKKSNPKGLGYLLPKVN